MMPGGGRMLSYNYTETKGNVTPVTWIPVVGTLVGGADAKSRTQMLQVSLNKDEVVEDYQFNDNTTNSQMGGGLLNMGGTSVQAPTAGQPK
jgi:hypothetical protein